MDYYPENHSQHIMVWRVGRAAAKAKDENALLKYVEFLFD